MEIEFVDVKVKMVEIRSLKIGQTFLSGDGMNDVCMYCGLNTDHGDHMYIIMGEAPEMCYVKGTFQVRPVKSKLIVEI